jgi:hypothetical protein
MRKTNPISPGRGAGVKSQVSSQEGPASSSLTSDFTLQTSNSAPNAPMGGVACETKPILG